MKRIVTILFILLCVAASAVRWLDVVNYTDLSTGFVTHGSYVWRYVAAGSITAVLILFSRTAPEHPQALGRQNKLQGVLVTICGILFAALGGLGIYQCQLQDRFGLLVHILYLFTGLWMLLLGKTRFTEVFEAPSRSAILGVVGTLSFYLLVIERFGLSPTGIVRVGTTLQGLGALSVLLFCTAQLKSAYVPGGKRGAWVWFTGMAAFLFATCLALPGVICTYWVGQLDFLQLLEAIALAVVGITGATYAVTVMES